MSKTCCDIRIGTSGWYYNHWVGVFYPEKLPKNGWFEYYAKDFDTVEINNTFYQLPKEQSLEKWYKRAPKNFIYSVKANRYITHIKRLKETSDALERFFEIIGLLKETLGPILYQLPPSLHKNLELLESFIELLPAEQKGVFEFRHKSWYSPDTFGLLDEHNLGFCVHDLDGVATPRIVTGGIIYIRFHGPAGRYAGNYSKSALQDWAKWLKDGSRKVRGIYAYFNNDIHAYAVNNAKTLKNIMA